MPEISNQEKTNFPPLKKRHFNNSVHEGLLARELHKYLEVGRDHSDWIKDRIAEYGFEKDKEFWVFRKTGENLQGGRPSIEYFLCTRMVKEICLLHNSPQAKAYRNYLIDLEEQNQYLLSGLAAEHVRRIKKRKLRTAIEEKYVSVQNFAKLHNLNYNRFLECINFRRSHQATLEALERNLGIKTEELT